MTSDLFSLAGKTALVTGGSRGIGAMIARGLLDAGATIVISSRKIGELTAAQQELAQYGDVAALSADVSTVEGVKALAAQVGERFPSLNILVNNAGATWGQPIEEFTEAGWDRTVDTNLKGVFFLTQALLPNLRAAGTFDDPARVINVGSIDGLHVNPMDTYPYSASKAGVHHMTRALARRLGPDHITVNAIAPGPFESKMMASTLEAFGDSIAKSAPLGRIGRADDMAGVAVYLASRAGAYVTGAIIPVDGGIGTTS
ncbi:MAG: 3-oxoacyl-ACP reductase [Acidimicrobiales bacterium]|nr:3-oxoacyl-ACP reductase [Acidimicrobiales bacterium]